MSNMKTVQVTAAFKENFTIEAKMREHTLFIDQPKAGGGDNNGPTPLEYLFVSLAGCIGSIALIMAKQKRIRIRDIKVDVTGELDADVLMGKSKDKRAGFNGLKALVKLDADMSDEEKRAFLKEVDERCPISDNIMRETPVSIELSE